MIKKFLIKSVLIIILMLTIYYIICLFFIFYSKDNFIPEDYEDVDAIIVLGAYVKEDGRPSKYLKGRLDKTLEYDYLNVPIVVSGGKGNDEPITEAKCMKQYLVDKGMNPSKIYEESQATSTYENLSYSKDILDDIMNSQNYSILVITNDFHIFRAHMLANRLQMNTYLVGTDMESGLKNIIREPIAIGKSIIFDRG